MVTVPLAVSPIFISMLAVYTKQLITEKLWDFFWPTILLVMLAVLIEKPLTSWLSGVDYKEVDKILLSLRKLVDLMAIKSIDREKLNEKIDQYKEIMEKSATKL